MKTLTLTALLLAPLSALHAGEKTDAHDCPQTNTRLTPAVAASSIDGVHPGRCPVQS